MVVFRFQQVTLAILREIFGMTQEITTKKVNLSIFNEILRANKNLLIQHLIILVIV